MRTEIRMVLRGCRSTVVLVLTGALTGCALHYYDVKTSTEHLWGFGHLKMRSMAQKGEQPPFTNAAVAFVTGVRTLGISVSAGEGFAGIAAGCDLRSRVIVASEDAHFSILWPTNAVWLPRELKDIFSVRVGSGFPPANLTLVQDLKSKETNP